eukprot:4000052-Prymnesium_polylepis.1
MPAATWSLNEGLNCWVGHGAQDVDTAGPLTEATSLSACKAVCEQTVDCEGLVVIRSSGACYRKKAIDLPSCSADGAFAIADTYVLQWVVEEPPRSEHAVEPEPTRPDAERAATAQAAKQDSAAVEERVTADVQETAQADNEQETAEVEVEQAAQAKTQPAEQVEADAKAQVEAQAPAQ